MPRVILISIDGLAAFYWRDPRVRIPALRALADRGVVARGMEAVFPTTTWPTHVSMVTGVRPRAHGVVGNSILNRATGQPEELTGDPIYDAPDLLRGPTLYDRAHAGGLTTAAIDWPATRGSQSLAFNLPFFKDQRVFESHTPPATWSELKTLGYPVERQGEWAELPKRFLKDAMVADLAAHVLRRHAPHLLLVHFLSTDSFQHLYGPRSPEAYWAIEYVDGLIGQLLASLPPDELDSRTALFVVSDHGFLRVAQEVRVNVRLRQLGLLQADTAGRVQNAEARFIANLGAGYVYLSDRRNAPTLARDLAPELGKLEGISRVWTADDYPALGLPAPEENSHAGDLILEAAPGYDFANEAHGGELVVSPPRYRGTHGQLPTHPENLAFFLAAGAGIGRGLELPAITSRDVAPTLAHALGLAMDASEGRLLTEILS
ncbi:MAG: alkaline phosphatase family protein [Candidatus Rokubacteria bacterium]|nr:alkaline phosphatase family protein [Candidatus Rokubacteria bacterium]